MPAPLVSALGYLLAPAVMREAAVRMGMPESVAPPPVGTALGALGSLYGMYKTHTASPEELGRMLQMIPPTTFGDPDFDAEVRALQEERDKAMDYGYAYPQPQMLTPAPQGYTQPTEEELRGLGAANGGLAALLRSRYA